MEGFRLQLRDILTVNATLVAQRQNEEIRELTEASIAQGEEVKKISAWAAILFAPTLVGTVYGMNFDAMPELHWHLGYPFALLLMVAGQRRRCTWCSSGATGSERGDRTGRTTRGVVRLPGGALVRGRRLGDAASRPTSRWCWRRARAGLAAPAGPRGRTSGCRPTRATRSTRCARRAAGRSAGERVEVACRGGVGRTGTALAALAVLDGLTPGRRRPLGARRLPPAGGRDAVAAVVAAPGPLRTPSSGGTRPAPVPLGCPHNYTGGEWSRLRSCDQGKRAEEGNDDLVNHPLQKTQAPILISTTSLSLPDSS